MKRIILGVLSAGLLAGAGAANAQPSQLAHDEQAKAEAEAAHQQALKSGDRVAITRTMARVRAADEDIYGDKKDAQMLAAPPATGETRAAEVALIDAKEAHMRAIASGNQQDIARTQAALRAAYERDYALRHGQHPH